MKILIVDDDLCLARTLQRILREHHVVIEGDPAQAIAAVRGEAHVGAAFDIVICDFSMRGMSGLDVLAALRADPRSPGFILMSGYHDIVQAASIADAVLIKPFQSSEIRDAIASVRV